MCWGGYLDYPCGVWSKRAIGCDKGFAYGNKGICDLILICGCEFRGDCGWYCWRWCCATTGPCVAVPEAWGELPLLPSPFPVALFNGMTLVAAIGVDTCEALSGHCPHLEGSH